MKPVEYYIDDREVEIIFICKICGEIKERKRKRELSKKCNICVLSENSVIEHRKLVRTINGRPPLLMAMPHGGKKVRKGSFADVDEKNGFLKKAENPTKIYTPHYFVIL